MRLAKYKSAIEVVNEQLQSVRVSESTIYAIEKAIRARVAQGKYGADNSHVVCFESELANKPSTDRLNQLVYGQKSKMAPQDPMSQVLFDRLQVTADEVGFKTAKKVRPLSAATAPGLDHKEWLRQKDTAVKLKRQLISRAQQEIRSQLLSIFEAEKAKEAEKKKGINKWIQEMMAKDF